MSISKQIAKHLRDVHFGGNWTCSNYKDLLKDVTWQQAIQTVHTFNTIATLVYHTHYYIVVTTKVLQGEPLVAKDEHSFNCPAFHSQKEWDHFLEEVWRAAEEMASLIEQLPDSLLNEIFVDEKYGTYYRNLQGMIEHHHYHLGQIAMIKKMLLTSIS